jgi:hypothetical protein
MYHVIQDAVYYYISKQNPQMHQINMMFIDFFSKRRKKPNPFDQLHKSVYDYHLTPSSQYFRDTLLGYNEKYIDEIEFSPIFTMFLYPLTLTKYGREYLLQIINVFGEKLQEFGDDNKVSLLRYYFNKYKIRNLDRMLKLKAHIKIISTNSENEFRESKNIPRIGENWIEETRLYNQIKADFPNLLTIQHGRPKFLGKQHYDIWIPKIKTAIEYQGEQHYKPIEFFGGEDNYKNQLERDRRKLQIGIENGIDLICVNNGYEYKLIFDKIKSKLR